MVSVSVAAVTLLVFLGSFATARDATLDGPWRDWKATHSRVYSKKGEEEYRRNIWESNLHVISRHNQEASQGKHAFRLKMNQFGDLGSCGSCWAFSATGALEGLHARTTGNLVSLSEQNILDCSTYLGTNGCGGGWMPLAFEYVAQNNGIDSEQSYPYQAQSGLPCRYSSWYRAATCNSLVTVQSGSEEALEEAVAIYGPVSVAVDASSIHFQFYSSGVFSLPSCGESLDHGMLVVGYGVSQYGWDRQSYWLLKNSWGTEWGEEGYIQIAKGTNNICGVATAASFPIM
ncbi:PREDICTED: cathepsin L1-like [Gekko japonicus]|uniref:Cathepsin L1-like n=1 Tax=Gekko japonicus TaxID=146911 RepID=A0ABM1L893_GEKJA|nr:PREDICTED: cathepsin L1-like [Gekko japonicus]